MLSFFFIHKEEKNDNRKVKINTAFLVILSDIITKMKCSTALIKAFEVIKEGLR